MQTLFATSGIRGDAESLLTNQFCFDVGRAFAIFLKNNNQKNKAAIGMDPRPSSSRIQKAVMSGLIKEGIEVTNEGITPIPSMNYILLADKTFGGSIMITGSHIKSHLNGIKFFIFEEELLKKDELEIDKIYFDLKEKVSFEEKEIPQPQQNALNFYKKHLMKLASVPYPNWKVVVDTGNGAQTMVIPSLFRELGIEIIPVNNSLDQQILSRDTEDAKEFQSLMDKVKEVSADFGVAYDSDGDRTVFVNENGEYIPGDYSASLIAKEAQGDTIVTPISTSQVIDNIRKNVVRTKVGSPQVSAKMKEINAHFGFEANGGGIFKDMLSRDGGRTSIEVLNILKAHNKKLSELIAELPKFYNYKDKVDYKWELKDKIINDARENFKGIKVEELDGLKIWIDEKTWILFRSSGNAPEFRVFAESNEDQKAKDLLKKGIDFVNQIISSN
ncbi:hypothetical protein HYS03_00640 [Candidatus Woesebacteria bacterium]|nr:hypothetical protein [Candidatus Woesebacteria bacterium]QQG47170.1 MAG: hypothetical protein HY044_03455 [Candidatus Woesebacteria bacterium]